LIEASVKMARGYSFSELTFRLPKVGRSGEYQNLLSHVTDPFASCSSYSAVTHAPGSVWMHCLSPWAAWNC